MAILLVVICRKPSLGLVTKTRAWAKREAWECERVWEWTLTLQSELSFWKLESWWIPKSLERYYRGQNPLDCGVPHIIGKLLERKCLGHLKHKLWPKEKSRVKLVIWLPTTKSQELTQFPYVQVACDIPLERSRQGLQLCLNPHLNQRSSHKVMGPQNCRSLNFGNFGIPKWES